MTLIESLEAFRVSQHLTRSEFIRKYGLKRSTYYQWLHDVNPCQLHYDKLRRLGLLSDLPPGSPGTKTQPVSSEGVTP